MNWKKILFGTWSWKRPFYSLSVIYLILLLLVLTTADLLIFRPPVDHFEPPNAHFGNVLTDPEETISTYYRAPADGMPVLLWSHGNAEDLRYLYPLLDDLHEFGFGILAYDYPGYGLSSGKPSEQGCFDAIEACYEELLHRKKIPTERIILVGQSLGSGPTCFLAERQEVAGIILIAPVASTFRTVTRIPLFPNDRFVNLNRINQITEPTLFIHGSSDRVVSHWNSEILFEKSAATHKELFSIPDAGHNNLWLKHSSEIVLKIEDFAAQVYARGMTHP